MKATSRLNPTRFSFGMVLYELATGRRAFQRGTAAETTAAIIREEADDSRSVSRIETHPRAALASQRVANGGLNGTSSEAQATFPAGDRCSRCEPFMRRGINLVAAAAAGARYLRVQVHADLPPGRHGTIPVVVSGQQEHSV